MKSVASLKMGNIQKTVNKSLFYRIYIVMLMTMANMLVYSNDVHRNIAKIFLNT